MKSILHLKFIVLYIIFGFFVRFYNRYTDK